MTTRTSLKQTNPRTPLLWLLVLALVLGSLAVPASMRGQSRTLTWTGVVPDGATGDWDVATTLNWLYAGAGTFFNQGDNVIFDDTAPGQTNVNLTTQLNPSALTITNNQLAYTFTGSGGLTGVSTTLVKAGTNSLVVQNTGANTFSGGVLVTGGTLLLQDQSDALGGNLTATNGGQVIVDDNPASAMTGSALIFTNSAVQVGNNDGNGALPAGPVTLSAGGSLIFDSVNNPEIVSTAIYGAGTLIQSNASGVLRLATMNLTTFSGPVLVQQGTLQFGVVNALNASNSPITILNGATLDVNGIYGSNTVAAVQGAGVNGNGAIVNNGASVANNYALANITLTGDTYFGGTGVPGAAFGGTGLWELRTASGNPAFGKLACAGGVPHNLYKVGANWVGIVGVTVDTNLANIDVQNGIFDIEGNTTGLGNPTNTLSIEAPGILSLYAPTNQLNKVFVLNDGATMQNYIGAVTVIGPVTLNTNASGGPGTALIQTVYYSSGAQSFTFSNKLSGPGNLFINAANGPILLAGTNTYTGTTTISNGTLSLIGNGSISKTASITLLPAGTLNTTNRSDGTLTLASGQTLTGSGTILGALTNSVGATVAPGSAGVTGTLAISRAVTLGGTTYMKLDGAASDELISTNTITYGGTLVVSNLGGALALGNTFKLFQGAGYASAFASVQLPALGANQVWQNNLSVNGTIEVVSSITRALTWTGVVPDGGMGDWDVANTLNWLYAGAGTFFNQGDSVFFDDTAPGQTTVNLTTQLTPIPLLTITNNRLAYTFTGSGGLTGASTTLVKAGTNSLIVQNTGSNTLGGGVLVMGGTLLLQDQNDALGGNLTATNGGQVILDDNSANPMTGSTFIYTNSAVQIGNNDGNGALPAGPVTLSAGGKLIFDTVNSPEIISNAISGAGTLIQSNASGVLRLSKTNLTTFSGPVLVQQGTLQFGVVNALNASNSPITILNGATLDVNGIYGSNTVAAVQGAGVNGNGAIVNNGANVANNYALANITLTGDTYFGGTGIAGAAFGGTGLWELRTASGNPAFGKLACAGGVPHNLYKIGANWVGLVGVTVDTNLANIDVQNGIFDIEGNTTGLGNPTNTLSIESPGILSLYAPTNQLNKVFVLNDGATMQNYIGAVTVIGPVTLNTNASGGPGTALIQTVYYAAGAQSFTFSNKLSGPGNLVINAANGPILLAGTNTYTGTTTINNGTLSLIGNGSISNTTSITLLPAGTLNVTNRSDGTLTLANGQTLTGAGTILGALTSTAGTTVAPGSVGATGTLTNLGPVTLGGTTYLKLNGTASDEIISLSSAITYAGTLIVTSIGGAPGLGDSFTLFQGGGYAGAFASLQLPALDASLAWQNNLSIDGTLVVISSSARSLAWTGAVPDGAAGDWDVANTLNWLCAGAGTFFNQGDNVVFDDTAPGLTTVNLTTQLDSAAVLMITNNRLAYTFTGSGGLTGASTTLVKAGTNSLVVQNTGANTFSGGVLVAGGTLLLQDQSDAIGGNLTAANGGRVILDDNPYSPMSGSTFIYTNSLVQIGNNDGNGALPAGPVTLNAGGTLLFNSVNNPEILSTAIYGAGTLIQSNASGVLQLTATNNNTFSGPVVVQRGTLQFGVANALNPSNSPITILNGATLDINGISSTDTVAAVQGSGVNGNGAIVNNGATPPSNYALQYITLTGDTYFGGTGTWYLRYSGSDTAAANCRLTCAGGVPHNLYKIGTNLVGLVDVTVDANLANIDVQNGTFDIEGTTTGLGNPTNTLSVEFPGVLMVYEATNRLNKVFVFNDGAIMENFQGAIAVLGPVTLNTNASGGPGTVYLNTPASGSGGAMTFSNKLSGPGNLFINASNGVITLAATNTYTGTTTLNYGTLSLAGNGSISKTASINLLPAGILNVTNRSDGTLTLASGQTLTGSGTILGALTNSAGATVAPGSASSTGTLAVSRAVTLGGTTYLKLKGAASDELISTNAITYGGTLVVTNIGGALTLGNTFTLFQGTNYANAFASLQLPALSAGLVWLNNLSLNGTISVAVYTNPTPPWINSATWSGGNLIFNGTNGPNNGASYYVLTSTNLALPLSSWTILSTNTFGGSGSFSVTNPIVGGGPPAFFVLKIAR